MCVPNPVFFLVTITHGGADDYEQMKWQNVTLLMKIKHGPSWSNLYTGACIFKKSSIFKKNVLKSEKNTVISLYWKFFEVGPNWCTFGLLTCMKLTEFTVKDHMVITLLALLTPHEICGWLRNVSTSINLSLNYWLSGLF